jgi:hypothetical protein
MIIGAGVDVDGLFDALDEDASDMLDIHELRLLVMAETQCRGMSASEVAEMSHAARVARENRRKAEVAWAAVAAMDAAEILKEECDSDMDAQTIEKTLGRALQESGRSPGKIVKSWASLYMHHNPFHTPATLVCV